LMDANRRRRARGLLGAGKTDADPRAMTDAELLAAWTTDPDAVESRPTGSPFQQWLASLSEEELLPIRRHMERYGTTSEQLGHVAVTFRDHANRNPRAVMRDQILTLEDHQSSRFASPPCGRPRTRSSSPSVHATAETTRLGATRRTTPSSAEMTNAAGDESKSAV